MVMAAMMGISLSDYYIMDQFEYAAYLRGWRMRKNEEMRWDRFVLSAMLSPHSKKAIDPKKLITIEGDDIIVKQAKTDFSEAEKVWKKWDEMKLKQGV